MQPASSLVPQTRTYHFIAAVNAAQKLKSYTRIINIANGRLALNDIEGAAVLLSLVLRTLPEDLDELLSLLQQGAIAAAHPKFRTLTKYLLYAYS